MNFEDSQYSDVNEIDTKNVKNDTISSEIRASSSISTTPEHFSSDEWTLSSGSEDSSLTDTTIDITMFLDNLSGTDASERSQISRNHLESGGDSSLDSRNEEHCSEISDIFQSNPLHLKSHNHGLTKSWISTTKDSHVVPYIDSGLSDEELFNDKLNEPETYSICNDQADDPLKMFQCFGTITRQDVNLGNTSTDTHLAKRPLSEMRKDDYESSASSYVTTKDVEIPATETMTQVSVVDPLATFMDVNKYNETESELISTPDFKSVKFKSDITTDSSSETLSSDDTKDSSKKGSYTPTFSGVSTHLNSSDEVKIVHSTSLEDDLDYKDLSDYLDETSSSNTANFSNEADSRIPNTHVPLTEIKEIRNLELDGKTILCGNFSEVSNICDSNKCDEFTRSLEGDADTVKMETKESELNKEFLDDLIIFDSSDSDELPDSANCSLEPNPFIYFSQDSKTLNKTLPEATKNTSHLELSFTRDTLRKEKKVLDLCESKLLEDIQGMSSKRIQSNYQYEDLSSKNLFGIYETKYDIGGHTNSSTETHFSKTKSSFELVPIGKNTIYNKLDPIETSVTHNIEKPRVSEMKDFTFDEKLSKSSCCEIENKLINGNIQEPANTDNFGINEVSNAMVSETSHGKIPYTEDMIVNEDDNNKGILSTFTELESSNEFCFKENSMNCAETGSKNCLEDIITKQCVFSKDMNIASVSIPCQFKYSVDSSKTGASSKCHQGDQRIKQYMQYLGRSDTEKNESESIRRDTETCKTITNKEIKKSVFEHIKLHAIADEERCDKELTEMKDETPGIICVSQKDTLREQACLTSSSNTLSKLVPCKVIIHPLKNKILKTGKVLESSEVNTSPMDTSHGEPDTQQIASNIEVQYLALQMLFEVDKAIAKGVIMALSDLKLKKGANFFQIRKFLTQKKLVRVHSKLENDLQRFLKSAEEVGIVEKTGLKYQLPSKLTCSKQKSVSRRRGVALKVRTPTSRRLEALQKRSSNSPSRFTQHLRSKSIKIPPGTPKRDANNRNGARVFKNLRSRVVMLRNNF